jgi:hypothetical protein
VIEPPATHLPAVDEPPPHPIFSGVGTEIEYMIVDAASLDVRPLADELLRDQTGADTCPATADRGETGWSNEFVLHLIELKTAGPQRSLLRTAQLMREEVAAANRLLAKRGARLLPGGAHPWMDPKTETRLWPHEGSEIYAAYDRIFDARQHGYANVQSVHLNYPFADDDQFGRLHAAVRLILPLIPALAAASPILDGAPNRLADARLGAYMANALRVPLMTGDTIPEPVYTSDDYRRLILAPLYDAMTPLDPEGVLEAGEWLNARGAIARFERNAIEIRLVDAQECPLMDMGIAAAVTGALKGMVEERWVGYEAQRRFDTGRLKAILLATMADAESTIVADREYAALFGVDRATTAGQLWRKIRERSADAWPVEPEVTAALDTIFTHGTLATRLLRRLAGDYRRQALTETWRELARSLDDGVPFVP